VRINEKGKIELRYGTAHKNEILKWIGKPENQKYDFDGRYGIYGSIDIKILTYLFRKL
jgi:hypothetical protein